MITASVRSRASRTILAAVLTLTLAGASACAPNGEFGAPEQRPPAAEQNATATAPPVEGGSVAQAAEIVLPSVVNVSTQVGGQGGQQGEGVGSGIVIRADGHILTNNHVIAQADQVFVTVGGREVQAEVVGADARSDLAVLRVDGDLTPAEMGDPGDLVVGQWVVAVGSPFGLDKTVTAGVVSALERQTVMPTVGGDVATYTNLIQTDASINPGNSGGALATLDGRVVGVNTLIQAQVPQAAGIGLAIPIDFAMDVAEELIETGEVEHTFLGVQVASLTPQLAEQAGVAVDSGAIVFGAVEGGPAAGAGIGQGDVIVRIGQTQVETAGDVYGALRQYDVGETVEIEYVRGEQTETANVTLAAAP